MNSGSIHAEFVGGPVDGEVFVLPSASPTWAVLEQPPAPVLGSSSGEVLVPRKVTYRRDAEPFRVQPDGMRCYRYRVLL